MFPYVSILQNPASQAPVVLRIPLAHLLPTTLHLKKKAAAEAKTCGNTADLKRSNCLYFFCILVKPTFSLCYLIPLQIAFRWFSAVSTQKHTLVYMYM